MDGNYTEFMKSTDQQGENVTNYNKSRKQVKLIN